MVRVLLRVRDCVIDAVSVCVCVLESLADDVWLVVSDWDELTDCDNDCRIGDAMRWNILEKHTASQQNPSDSLDSATSKNFPMSFGCLTVRMSD